MAASANPPLSSFLSIDVLAACHEYGPQLKLPAAAGLIGWKVAAAIASVESSMGADCGPRHEPAYDVGGAVWRRSAQQQALVAKYPSPPGSATPCSPAAMSYGPWQCMFDNCQPYAPSDLLEDLDVCAECFVALFNSYVEGHEHAATLEEIGEVWNAGHITPDPAYTNKLAAAYAAQ